MKSDLWFSNADALPWFIEEMGLESCYDAHYHEHELKEKYGIYRRLALGTEYGHHFVFTDEEKYNKELSRHNIEKASSSSKKPVESSTMNNSTNSYFEDLLRPIESKTMNINHLTEELNNARQLVQQLENTIRDSNKERVQAFKEEFNALREKYNDVKLLVANNGNGTIVVARIKNPTGLNAEEVDLF